jgi:hypothetical protein
MLGKQRFPAESLGWVFNSSGPEQPEIRILKPVNIMLYTQAYTIKILFQIELNDSEYILLIPIILPNDLFTF